MENQVIQLATLINNLKNQCELPAETVIDLVQNVSAIILLNDKELQEPASLNVLRHDHVISKKMTTEAPKQFSRFDDVPFPKRLTGFNRRDAHEIMEDFLTLLETSFEENIETEQSVVEVAGTESETHVLDLKATPNCMDKSIDCLKDKNEKDILETFRKVDVNIPLLDSIKQELKSVEFLKEF